MTTPSLTPTIFRNLIDSVASYSELIPVMQLLIEQPLSKEYGNSFLHALSLLDSSHLEFEEWKFFYQIVSESFPEEYFDKSTYPSLIRVSCSEFGYMFLNNLGLFEKTITSLLQLMQSQGITLRKRTLSPIIQAYHREGKGGMGMSIFALSKVNNITLDAVDLSCLLTSSSSLDQMTILQEILGNPMIFDAMSVSILEKSFSCTSYTVGEDNYCGDFQIPEFNLSLEEKKRLLLTLENHVDEKTTHRKGVRKAFHKCCSSYNKKFTAVVDGANVGRFQQGTKSQGKLNYTQIKNVVGKLQQSGHRVLLCLNENHLKKMDAGTCAILREIKELCYVLQTPSGLDDDLCWLYACISLPRAFLVTMDELRNHIYTIDSVIQKWKQYRRITFEINRGSGDVTFKYPLSYEVKPHLQKTASGHTLWLPIQDEVSKWCAVEL